MIDVCNISVMKPLLAQYGFHFSKAKGQNFLIASWVPERIAEDSGVSADTGVLEVGPGIGSLTQQLCLRAQTEQPLGRFCPAGRRHFMVAVEDQVIRLA